MWYYSKDNQQHGPVSEAQMKSLLLSAQVSPSSLVWREGMADWKAATDVAELQSAIQITPTVAATPQSPLATGAANPYVAPQQAVTTQSYSQPSYYGTPINSGGILAFAIVSTVLCCWPLGIPAIVYAAKINSQIAAGDIAGAMASAKTSKMWSWISMGSCLVLLVIYFIFFGVAAASGSIQ